jgi:hypothetical protein
MDGIIGCQNERLDHDYINESKTYIEDTGNLIGFKFYSIIGTKLPSIFPFSFLGRHFEMYESRPSSLSTT